MQINTGGLVLMEKNVGESDRLVTVLTRDEGVIRAFAQQAKRLQNRKLSSTQLPSYPRLSVYKGRDKYTINDVWPVESFFDLRLDTERLSLAQYFCELAAVLAPEEAEAGNSLRPMLNSLHFLARGLRPNLQLKAVVEMRTLALAGYMPDLVCCHDCGCYGADIMFFLPRSRGIVYRDCFSPMPRQEEPAIPLPCGVVTALRHTICADLDKLFSPRLSDNGLRLLTDASEQYLLSTVQRRFATLDFYHQMTRSQPGGRNTMDHKLIFCRVEPKDLPCLLDLYLGSIELMRFQGIDQWDDVYPSEDVLMQDIANRELYILEDDNGPAASIVLNEDRESQYRYVDWQCHTGPVGVIHRLYVDAGHQGRGCGKKTARMAEEYFREKDYAAIRLDAFPKNEPAIRLYRSLGYEFYGRILFHKGVFHCFERSLAVELQEEQLL